ncbi:putative CHAT domain-containing protein [Gammaproteobacteria bacterium]
MDYPTLKITQISLGDDHYRCELTLDSNGHFTATIPDFHYRLETGHGSEVHWYLEEYPQYPSEGATPRARLAQKHLKEVGQTLFNALFLANDDTRMLWDRAKRQLNSLRIEVSTVDEQSGDSHHEPSLDPPWELLYDPAGREPLVSLVRTFVRLPNPPILPLAFAPGEKGKLRILFVIAYPDEPGGEAPFRSVARHLFQGLSAAAKNRFDLEVLYPPTFAALTKRLRQAQTEGNPFHVVHYDGQGILMDPTKLSYRGFIGWLKSRIASLLVRVLSNLDPGYHGYLLFAPPGRRFIPRPISGSLLGKLLAETDTPWLVVNACSALYIDDPSPDDQNVRFSYHPYQPTRAFASLARDAVAAGINGVVTLDHMVPTASSAQFAADLYAALGSGCDLGEAVNRGRRRLYRHPRRDVGLAPLDLPSDWSVPLVYETASLHLFPSSRRNAPILRRNTAPPPSWVDELIPARPATGFFGRDDILATLDHAFEHHQVILLYGPVGSGKTQVAAEWIRWMVQTGHITNHLVIWTDFTHDGSLERIWDDLRRAFEPFMEEHDLSWPWSEDERQKRRFAMRLLLRVPVLWIWDHIESIDPNAVPWTNQKEIAFFLRVAKQTKSRFLLLSHQEEPDGLSWLPTMRIPLPPLPVLECLAMIRTIAEKVGRHFTDPTVWRPLIDFIEGNPSSLTLLVTLILQKKIETPKELKDFIEHIQTVNKSEEKETDEAKTIIAEGYDYPLSAILAYQFVAADFTDLQQRRLSLLHLFQGFVDVDVLVWMGDAENPESLPVSFRGLTHEDWLPLLHQAVSADLLVDRGDGYYSINPIRSVFFRRLFLNTDAEFKIAVMRAYLVTMGDIGNYYYEEYEADHHEMLDALPEEEANLRYAWQFALWQGWWDVVINVARGLLALYRHTQQENEEASVVGKLTRDFVDTKTDNPLVDNPDREEYWGIVTDYRVELAHKTEDWPLAERLQQLHIDWDRRRAAGLLDRPLESLDDQARTRIRSLALSIAHLGYLLREQGKVDCLHPFQVALELNQRIGNYRGAALTALQMGNACRRNLPGLQEQAEQWYQKALALVPEEDLKLQTQIRQWIDLAEGKSAINSPGTA